VSPPRPNPNQEWKKSKAKTEDLLALLNSGFLWEKEVDMWRAAAGDPYPMEKNPDEIPAIRGARVGSPSERFLQGAFGVLRIEYLNLNPTVSSTPPSSSTFAKPSWGSNPTGYSSGSFPIEAPAECQQPPSSWRSRHPDARGRRGVVPCVQVDRLQPRLEV
jgi:hypothetical protein